MQDILRKEIEILELRFHFRIIPTGAPASFQLSRNSSFYNLVNALISSELDGMQESKDKSRVSSDSYPAMNHDDIYEHLISEGFHNEKHPRFLL